MKFLVIGALAVACIVDCSVALEGLAKSFPLCAAKFANGDPAEVNRLIRMQLVDQPQDHCFAKCLWTDSNQYNESTNSIDVTEMIDQLSSGGHDVPPHLVDLMEPTDGSCKALFEKTRTFVQRELSNFEE